LPSDSFDHAAEVIFAHGDCPPDLDDGAVHELLGTFGDTRAATPAPMKPDHCRNGEREEACPPPLGHPPVRAEQLVGPQPCIGKNPGRERPDSSPGEASAMASRKDRDISRREGEANSATLAANRDAVADHPVAVPAPAANLHGRRD